MKLLLVTVLLLLQAVHQSNSQLCNNRQAPLQYLASPSPYRGVATLASTPTCTYNQNRFNCPYGVILGDNEPVPPQPNLENSGSGKNDIGKFLVWNSSTDSHFMAFGLGGAQMITTINIEFLNYPAQGFSLPNLQLYSTKELFITDPSINSNTQLINFELKNNNMLSQDDYWVTTVSLIFSRTSSVNFLLRWNYTGAYNLNFFMVSEVDFCNDPQPPDETQITFQDPQSDNSVIIPTVEEFIGTTNTTLNCTISSSGLFEWRWRRNGSMISNNVKFSIFTADGTRTSILQLTGLNVSDAADYTCEVRRRGGGQYMSRTQTLNLSVAVDLSGQMTGYLSEKQVVLICEVYGFFRSTNPPTWLGRDGNPIDSNTPKYTIDISNSSQAALLLSNGSSVPGWRSTLTINQLGMADEGTYTCMVDGNSTTVQLTVVAGSARTTTRSANDGATLPMELIVAIVVVLVLVSIIVVVVIALLVIVCLKTHKQRYDSSKVHQLQNVNVVLDPETREDEKEKESIMMLYAVPNKKKKASNQAHGVPDKSSELVEYLDFKEEGDVGALYAIPDKKKKASNKAPGVPERSTKLIEHLDYEEVGIVTSGMGLSESSQTDSDAQRSSPSPAQQEPVDVAMLYAIPDKKKKVLK